MARLLPTSIKLCFGLTYLSASMSASLWFLDIIGPGLSNDLFWPNFDPTSAQTYLIDVFHRHLSVTNALVIDLYDPSQGILKAYGRASTTAFAKPTYPRLRSLVEYTSVADAITGFQSLDPGYVFNLMTLYCWADFGKRWEVAHTAARQARCAATMSNNGAVYLEAHLRNLNWDAWYAIYGASFEFGVADAIVVTPDGREWYQSLPNAFQTLENEVAYWTSHRISRFQLQWSNDYQFGLHESVSVVNMLGWRQDLTIQSIAFGERSSKWSTFVLNWAFYDDLWATAVTNGSLVRRAVSYIGDATIEVLLGMYPFTPASILVHNQIGPLQAIDMMLIAPPTALVTACTSYDVAVTLALQADHALLSLYAALPSLVLDPIPLSWQKPENYTFFGGSPFCLFGAGAPFVQPSFSFDDTCGSQVPSRLLVSPWPGLFAATSLNLLETSLKSCCTPCSAATQFSCELLVSNLQVISSLLLTNASLESLLVPMVQAATGAIQQLNVEIVQFALTSGGTETVLRQPLLRDGAWSFMGYVALHEWVNGFREAVSFQGDVATFNLISERIEPIPLRANAIEVPHSTCNYLYVVALLTSVALVAVACITAAYAFLQPTPDADGLHLPVYNQVAGPVWVGRPLLLLRAAAAITMLSTAPLNFGSDDGVARFRFAPRPLTHVGILAGEAAWVTYVLNDILLVAANQYARYAAPLSNLLVWLSLVVLEVFYPIRATAAVDRGCTRVDMGAVVTCHSGSVDLGSMARAWLILGINGIAIGLSYCIVWGYCVLKQKHLDDSEQTPLARMVSAGVEAFLAPKETNMWKLDASIAAMTGLLRFRFQSLCCIFDTKLWLFYYDDAGPVHIKPLISPEETMLTMAGAVVVASSRFAKLKVWSGLLYLAASVVGSLSYLELSGVNLANDLYWSTYNTSGTQSFLANWFNRLLMVNATQPSMPLDVPAFADLLDYSTPDTLISYARVYARLVQYEAGSDLGMMVQGLRSMDACQAPWIATSYCWLDFDRQIEMANTIARQDRCMTNYRSNSAVYLESILRNVDWPTFESCWGTSFEVGIAKDVPSLKVRGADWLTSLTNGNRLSVADEVVFWQSMGLLTYTTQWQNYKALGLRDVFSIENAFGLRYDMTLQSANGSYHIPMSTSWKTYWTFASDLWAIATNGSGIAGKSLLRQSPQFAFANVSLETMLTRNTTLLAPLDGALSAFRDSLGPFGAVDLYHVAFPASLVRLQHDAMRELTTLLALSSINSTSMQNDYANLVLMYSMSPVPRYLDRNTYLCAGGSLFCGEIPSNFNVSLGLSQFTGVDTMCYTSFNDWIFVNPMQAIFSVIASGIALDPTHLIPLACAAEVIVPTQCLAFLTSVSSFVSTHFTKSSLQAYRSQAIFVGADVMATSVGIMQYVRHLPTNHIMLFHQVLFDPSDATMMYTSYALAYDWAVGTREAIVAHGDANSVAVISGISPMSRFAASSMEMPLNVATYL